MNEFVIPGERTITYCSSIDQCEYSYQMTAQELRKFIELITDMACRQDETGLTGNVKVYPDPNHWNPMFIGADDICKKLGL